jgi:cytidyltransferase-like protein
MTVSRVYTTGVFDILHCGHLTLLSRAAALGPLTVGLMTDVGVEKTKGALPILSLAEREAQIRCLPFVGEVIHYTATDQVSMYEMLKPQIVVQGDDWLHSADRSSALDYLRKHKIRLILLPRTEGISTTEIRRRVTRSARHDEQFLLDRLHPFGIDRLRPFQAYDESTVRRLERRITNDRTFSNPLSVLRDGIVVDGANRLEALRRLGAKHVPCVAYDDAEVERLGQRALPRTTPDDIRRAAQKGELLHRGDAPHRVDQNVLRLLIALDSLTTDVAPNLTAVVRERIGAGAVRFFPSSVFLCDEW